MRRDASLLLAQRFPDDPQLQRDLLRGLGWGRDPVAAVALKNAAQNAAALGEHDQARQLWETLLHRFRGSATSADALYALGRRRPALRVELMRRFPAHPAALAAALEAGPAPADRLAELGLTPGAPIAVLRRGLLGGPIQVRVRDFALSLNRAQATAVQVCMEALGG